MDHEGKMVPLAQPAEKQRWIVQKECSKGTVGKIDLLLVQQEPMFAIAIRNKTYLPEQPKQIENYADFLATSFGPNGLVIYLTRDGEKSKTHGGKPYIRISYGDHILTWLNKCLRESGHSYSVNAMISCYREVVLRLLRKHLHSEEMKLG
jgi:PD-(D/E)XK nuclease superfamily